MTHPLREYRKRHELTQGALGKVIGASTYTIHRIETGKVRDNMPLSLAIAILRGTGGEVTPEQLATAP